MLSKSVPAKNIDEYIVSQPERVQGILEKFRQAIQSAAPEAEEVISYQMPAFKYHGVLVYFAAWKSHIGFYPTSSGMKAFKKELAAYAGAKGSIKFPLDKPIPYALVKKIVKFRVKENLEKAKLKSKSKKTIPGTKMLMGIPFLILSYFPVSEMVSNLILKSGPGQCWEWQATQALTMLL